MSLLLSLTTAFCSEWSRNPEPLFASSSVTQKKENLLHSFQSNIRDFGISELSPFFIGKIKSTF